MRFSAPARCPAPSEVAAYLLTVALRGRKAARAGTVWFAARGMFVVVTAEAAGVVVDGIVVGRGDGAGDGACVASVTARHAVALSFVYRPAGQWAQDVAPAAAFT